MCVLVVVCVEVGRGEEQKKVGPKDSSMRYGTASRHFCLAAIDCVWVRECTSMHVFAH